MQGIILSSFYYGYITTTLLGGVLALKFGGKILTLFAVLSTSVLTIVTPPLTVEGDYIAMITVRVVEGVGQVGAVEGRELNLRSLRARIKSKRPSLKTGRVQSTGLKSAPARHETRSGPISVFIVFNRWCHHLSTYCQYCTPFLLHCGLGLGLELNDKTSV